MALQHEKQMSFGNLFRRPEAGTFIGLIVVYAVFAMLGGSNFVGLAGLKSALSPCLSAF
jgi:simple sugar transport system permease protein